ncbi:MAG: Holliday junction branch migration protein RuvA [Hyphomicrobiales bacterium]|jgi:Holliday junction DNA helicase RuvA|nr:Holliday junction branch migration protein RuvA [Hyphomicrobiales bacterium]
MIGRLKGAIDVYGEDYVIVDVHGVGYVVFCSSRTLQALPPAGEAASLWIETQVREDAIRLFGFRSEAEQNWFRLLQSVQGVGAKVALALQSIFDPGDLATAIATGDKAQIARANGVGPKLAQRICVELKDKAPAFGMVDPGLAQLSGALDAKAAPRPVSDAVSALINLGYPQAQAQSAIASAMRALGDSAQTGQLIRQGLKELAK